MSINEKLDHAIKNAELKSEWFVDEMAPLLNDARAATQSTMNYMRHKRMVSKLPGATKRLTARWVKDVQGHYESLKKFDDKMYQYSKSRIFFLDGDMSPVMQKRFSDSILELDQLYYEKLQTQIIQKGKHYVYPELFIGTWFNTLNLSPA